LLQICSLLSSVSAVVLLFGPVTKTEGVWSVTVGEGMRGFVPVGGSSTPLLLAALSDGQLLRASDRKRLAAACGLIGLAAGIGLTLVAGRRV